MSRRVNRVEEACKEELSEILQREVKDPRIGFVTITRVRITPDLKHAVVYVSILGSEDEVHDTLKGLNSFFDMADIYIKKAAERCCCKHVVDIEIAG